LSDQWAFDEARKPIPGRGASHAEGAALSGEL